MPPNDLTGQQLSAVKKFEKAKADYRAAKVELMEAFEEDISTIQAEQGEDAAFAYIEQSIPVCIEKHQAKHKMKGKK